jgi:hypothetical protein
MTPTILIKPPWPVLGHDAPTPDPPEWLLERSLLKLLCNKMNWYKAAAYYKRKRNRLDYVSKFNFDTWTTCKVTYFGPRLTLHYFYPHLFYQAFERFLVDGVEPYVEFNTSIHSVVIEIQLVNEETHAVYQFLIDEKLRLFKHPSYPLPKGYDGAPLVSRYWHKLRMLFKVRPIAMYWLEQTVKRTMLAQFAIPGNIYSAGILIGTDAIAEQHGFETMMWD